MTDQDQYLREVFKEPPLIAYKRQNNIGGKGQSSPNPNREVKGMAKCGKIFTACLYIQSGNKVKNAKFRYGK